MLNNPLFTLSSQNTQQCETTGISRKFSQVIFWLALSLVWLPFYGFAQTECPSVNVKIQILITVPGSSPVRFLNPGKVFRTNS